MTDDCAHAPQTKAPIAAISFGSISPSPEIFHMKRTRSNQHHQPNTCDFPSFMRMKLSRDPRRHHWAGYGAWKERVKFHKDLPGAFRRAAVDEGFGIDRGEADDWLAFDSIDAPAALRLTRDASGYIAATNHSGVATDLGTHWRPWSGAAPDDFIAFVASNTTDLRILVREMWRLARSRFPHPGDRSGRSCLEAASESPSCGTARLRRIMRRCR